MGLERPEEPPTGRKNGFVANERKWGKNLFGHRERGAPLVKKSPGHKPRRGGNDSSGKKNTTGDVRICG